jgi:hypothetical protein
MPSFARPAIVLPIILIANLAFASYFLDLTLNPFAFSAPQPYRNLIFIVLFYACTLTLSLYLSQWPNVLSAKEKDALEAYIFSAETALALVWWFAVLILTPADGEKDVDWTSARVGILAGSSVFGFVGCGMICVVREYNPALGCESGLAVLTSASLSNCSRPSR